MPATKEVYSERINENENDNDGSNIKNEESEVNNVVASTA